MDGLIELCCGALSQNPQKAKESGRELFLPEDRIYESFEEMIQKESKLPEDKRMHFVIIVTPTLRISSPR
ncbi:hypothetical protein LWM68_13045 [Niabella sp. W65]|nr:hypothetical protein [Niabella sp. W65]MCH7363595.1 hypothetical protein [Niabella sp. W65]